MNPLKYIANYTLIHEVTLCILPEFSIGFYILQYWENVQALLGKIGKESIKRRIALFDIDTLELDIALGARKMLGNLLVDNVRQASIGAATFYVWVSNINDSLTLNSKE